jgi:hypothetical protein
MRPTLLAVSEHLASLFDGEDMIRVVITDAGIPPQYVNFDGTAVVVWAGILDYAEKVPGLTRKVLAAAIKYFHDNGRLRELLAAYERAREDRPMEYIPAPSNGNGRVDKVQDNVATLQLQVARLETQLEHLQETVDEMRDQHRWLVLAIVILCALLVGQAMYL